jgi:hypothetical protein
MENTSFLGESDSTSARTRLEQLMIEIGAINDRKRPWQEYWQKENEKLGYETDKPPELRALNKQLGPLYGEKEDLLRRFPHLEAEYGGKKKSGPVKSPLGAANPISKRERAARKKANHEANLARRREEDRARARGGTGGGGKKKG